MPQDPFDEGRNFAVRINARVVVAVVGGPAGLCVGFGPECCNVKYVVAVGGRGLGNVELERFVADGAGGPGGGAFGVRENAVSSPSGRTS